MRLFFTTIAISLLLAGCIEINDKPQLLGSAGVPAQSESACSDKTIQTHRGLNPDGFTVATWNIFKQRLPGWQEDLSELNANADILALQEASLQPDLVGWLGDRELNWDMNPAFDYQGVSYGVMTAGKKTATANCAHLHPEPWLGPPKALLASYFPFENSGTELLLINVHAVNFSFGPIPLQEQLQATKAILNAHTGPVILAGDFNTWSQARMEVLNALAEAHGLSAIEFPDQQPAQYLGRSLDHIYYRGLTVTARAVVAVNSSDHYPLTVTFRLDDA